MFVSSYREEAQPKFIEMVNANRRGLFMATLPYKVGILTAVTAAFASIPLIFDYDTVLKFNELYVTSGSFLTLLKCLYSYLLSQMSLKRRILRLLWR